MGFGELQRVDQAQRFGGGIGMADWTHADEHFRGPVLLRGEAGADTFTVSGAVASTHLLILGNFGRFRADQFIDES